MMIYRDLPKLQRNMAPAFEGGSRLQYGGDATLVPGIGVSPAARRKRSDVTIDLGGSGPSCPGSQNIDTDALGRILVVVLG
ncbi:hypothetical protein RCCGE510_05207 [Rhizobium sp. CCGE 510]|nr:hypothetical protein RCCGE510_05207 [Rhizobium sp. CCGE 510]